MEEMTETEDTIRAEYEDRLWAALERAVSRPIGPETEADLSAPYRQLMEELGLKGWGVRLVSGPTGTNTRGMHFFRAPKDWLKSRLGELPAEALSDRELLVRLHDMVYAYDRRRDDELEYLDSHPARDAWSDEQRAEYRDICDDIREQYEALRKVLEHITLVRKPPRRPSTPEVR